MQSDSPQYSKGPADGWPRADSRNRAAMLVLLGASVLSGCASVQSPQIFSDEILIERSATGAGSTSDQPTPKISLPAAIARAENLQRKYLLAVKELSELGPGINAALIGLSSFALFQGLRNPHPSDIAGAAVLGSAAYAYGANMASKPRERIYLAGNSALTCAVAAARPLDLREPGKAADTVVADVEKNVEQTRNAVDDLDSLVLNLGHLLRNEENVIPSRTLPARNTGCKPRPDCMASNIVDPEAKKDFLRRCDAVAREWDRQCSPIATAERREIKEPAPETKAAFAEAHKVSDYARKKMKTAMRVLARADDAGTQLWDKVLDIQTRVAGEVLKTEPDVGAVLSSLGSLKDIGSKIAGADLSPPAKPGTEAVLPTPKSESKVNGVEIRTTRQPVPSGEIQGLAAKTKAVRDQAAKIDLFLARFGERTKGVSGAIAQCQLAVPGVTLDVSPSEDIPPLKGGGTAVFSVSGGTGVPKATVTGAGKAASGKVVRAVDEQGHFRFTFTAPADAGADDLVIIAFSDAPGMAKKEVTLTFGGQAVTTTSPGNEPSPKDLALRPLLGLPADATVEQFNTAIGKCKEKMNKKPPADTIVDAATQKYIEDKNCQDIGKGL